jgi:hypothetical protein
MSSLITKFSANALIRDGRFSRTAKAISWGTSFGIIEFVLSIIRIIYGGVWVGGTVELYNDLFLFKPNAANDVMVKGTTRIEFPIENITGVCQKWGLETGIITMSLGDKSPDGVVFRCKNAKEIAEMIKSTIQKREITGSLS